MNFFFQVGMGYKAKKEMMPSSRGSKLSENQKSIEKIVQVKGPTNTSGWQESLELGGE